MLNATLEYNTSLARMQHVKRESDSTKKFTKKPWPYRSVVEKVIRGKEITYLAQEMFSVSDRKGRL